MRGTPGRSDPALLAVESVFAANVLYPSVALLFLVITIMGLITARGTVNPAKRRSEVGLQVAVWGALAVQFIIYPMLADRLFVVHYALVSILTVSLIGSTRGDERGMAGVHGLAKGASS